MARQSVNLPATPESTGVYGGNSSRMPTGLTGLSKGGGKVLPRYLRASTGSCHDFCKYGRKHAFEEKTRRPFPRKIMKKPPDDRNPVKLHSVENTTLAVKFRPSSSKTSTPTAPEIIKREVPTKSVVNRNPLRIEAVSKEIAVENLLTKSLDRSLALRKVMANRKTLIGEASKASGGSQSSVSRESRAEKNSPQLRKKSPVTKPRASFNSRTELSPEIVKQDVSSSSGKLKVSSAQASSKVKEANVSIKHASSSKQKLSSHGARGSSDIKMGQRAPKVVVKKVLSSPGASLSPKTPANGVPRGLASSKSLLSLKPSLSRVASLKAKKHQSSKVASSLKNQNKSKRDGKEQPNDKNADPEQHVDHANETKDDMVQEKTLYVIKMETENKYMESDRNENLSVESSPSPSSSPESQSLPNFPTTLSHDEEDEEESEYTENEADDDSFSEYDETDYVEETEALEGEHNLRNRRAGIVLSVDKDGQPVKLRFRRGRVIEIQSENNGPRRLKFRRRRSLGENQNVKADAQKSFKNRGSDDNSDESKPDPEKVVLRHQDVQAKKDAQGLFNNVIEETASKLVETRKSKVKALVGAFETVISLQDTKPPANLVS